MNRTEPVAAALVCLLATALAGTAQAAEPCRAKRLPMPVKLVGQRAIAQVAINGTPVPLMLDSGADRSMLTEAAAAQLKLTPGTASNNLILRGVTGQASARLAKVDKLSWAGGELLNVDFLVGGNEMGGGAMGMLSRSILAGADTEYDLAQGVVRLVYPEGDCSATNMAYWAGQKPVVKVPLKLDPWVRLPALLTSVKLNGVELVAKLDTGAPRTVVTLAAARRVGIAPDRMTPAGTAAGLAGQRTAPAWTAPFDSFALGGEELSSVRLRVAEISMPDADMLLGIDWFLAHRLYVAKGQKQLYFTYNGGPVFASNATPQGAEEAAGPAAEAPALDSADAYARRGAAALARRDLAQARADLDRAVELAPAMAGYRLLRGQVLRAQNRPDEAIKDLDEALRLDADQADARWERAQLLAERKSADAALDDLQALDRALAPQSDLRLAMAVLYGRLGRPALALPQLDQWLAAHRAEVRRAAALNERCWDRVLLNTALDQALADCNESLSLQPDDARALDSRGWLHLRRAEWRAALDDFEQALKREPGRAWSLYGRGLVRQKLGEAEAGRADLDAARQVRSSIDADALRQGLVAEAPR